jgi:hypothetical protein
MNIIGLEYKEEIFNNTNYFSTIHPNEINNYKTWQLNQPLRNMNDKEKLKTLDNNKKEKLDSLKIVKLLNYKFS